MDEIIESKMIRRPPANRGSGGAATTSASCRATSSSASIIISPLALSSASPPSSPLLLPSCCSTPRRTKRRRNRIPTKTTPITPTTATAATVLVAVFLLSNYTSLLLPTTAASSSIHHRELTPTPQAQELFNALENSWWNRELRAANEIVKTRRRRRQLLKQQRRELVEQHDRPRNVHSRPSHLRPGFAKEENQHDNRQKEEEQEEEGRHLENQNNMMDSKYNNYLPNGQQQEEHFAPDSLPYLDALNDNANTIHNQEEEEEGVDESSICLSPLQRWFISLIDSIGSSTYQDIEDYNITSVAYLYKHYISTSDGSNEYFGTYGERTREMKGNHDGMKKFWSMGQLVQEGQEAASGGSSSSSSSSSGRETVLMNNLGEEEESGQLVYYSENSAYDLSSTNEFSTPSSYNDQNTIMTQEAQTSQNQQQQQAQQQPASNVVLLGMHGVDLASNTKLVPTLQQMYKLDVSTANALASKIQDVVMTLPGAFNNPILTANAIAIQSSNPAYSSGNGDGTSSSSNAKERDSVIVGDGVFSFLEWLGLQNDGIDYIHSHEFGHHIQYEMGVGRQMNKEEENNNDGGTTTAWAVAEQTRHLELMSDAFGSYYLAHSLGARMSSQRLYQVHQAAYSLGDCEDARESHHGTPRQRECASNYGSTLALASYVDGGYIISPKELRRLFDETYDKILDLDGGICEAVVDSSVLDKSVYGEGYKGEYSKGEGYNGGDVQTVVGAAADVEESTMAGTSTSTNKATPQDQDNKDPLEGFNSQYNGNWDTPSSTSQVAVEPSPFSTTTTTEGGSSPSQSSIDETQGWFHESNWLEGSRTYVSSSGCFSAGLSSWSLGVIVVVSLAAITAV